MPKVKVNDIKMYYEVKGEGFPLVMINGANEHLDCWNPRLIEALSKKLKLVLFDNRDAGRTDKSNREYTVKMLADDTSGLMDALEISKAHVLGFSMGGMVAQELAINYPEKVSKLILCSTTCKGNLINPNAARVMLAVEQGRSLEEIAEMYRSLYKDYPSEFIRKYPSVGNGFTADFVRGNPDCVNLYFQRFLEHPISKEGAQRQFHAVREFNSQGRLQQIRVPTLVLHGKKDFGLPPENGSILAGGIPNARLVYLEKSAHCLAEEMEEMIRVITEFLP
jgi:pimeloyl-ACP methyl ester carboxylesterase